MRHKLWVIAVASALALTSCSNVVDGHAGMARPSVGSAIQWRPCAVAKDAECGELAVPADYGRPGSGVATIALARVRATGDKIGSLVLNPGGPGESGVESVGSMLDTIPREVRERFDIVGFDPRGVRNSRPAVWCNSDADNDRLRADPTTVDYSPAGVAHTEELTKQFVQRCVDKMGKEYLANVGTASVVKDLDALRVALGDPKLTYLGFSYGTRIGGAYAEAYPQNVRGMVLDGAVDPSEDPVEADIRQAAAFQKAFNDYAADCAKSPDCPLGTDPAKAVDVFHSLVDPLVQKPAPTQDPRGLSYNDATVGALLALYTPRFWRYLTDGLKGLANGSGDTLLAMSDVYMGRDKDGHYNNSTDVRVAVNCVDEPPVTDRAEAVEEDKRTREVAPFLSYGEFTGYAPLPTCAFWPVPPTSHPHALSVHGLPPTLVISSTDDPATPYQAGVDLAKQLGGSLLTFVGTQHTVAFEGNPCVDGFVTRYLVDLTVPPPDAVCAR